MHKKSKNDENQSKKLKERQAKLDKKLKEKQAKLDKNSKRHQAESDKSKNVQRGQNKIFNDNSSSSVTLFDKKKKRSESKAQEPKNILITKENNKIDESLIDKENNEIPSKLLEEIWSEILLGIVKSTFNETWNPLGFSNPKGYCYLNSVVQVLGSCEDFKRDIYNCKWISTEKTDDSIFVEGLFNLIRAIRENNKKNLNISLKIVQQYITECSFGDDVYKCFMNVLTRVNIVIKTNTDFPSKQLSSLPITHGNDKIAYRKSQNGNSGFVFDNFYGKLQFQTVCKHCNYRYNDSSQLIKSLPLPVPKSNSSVTLNSCIDLFFNESDVEVDEPTNCNCNSRSTKSLKSITKLIRGPKYLFIYLNRGSYTSSTQKNNTHVTCDGLTIEIKTIEDKSIKYKLISVIDHIGDSAGGHYYCKCSFESEEWWLLNDSHVDRLKNKNDIVTKSTIVFLFKITT